MGGRCACLIAVCARACLIAVCALEVAAAFRPPAACLPFGARGARALPTRGRVGHGAGGVRVLAGVDGADRASPDDSLNSELFASLRARQEALKSEEQRLVQRWRTGQCASKAQLFLDDWVRRVSLDWPLVAVGSAGGSVFVADAQSGKVLAESRGAHPAYIETMEAEMQMRQLHGDYDGGGVTALELSLSQNTLVSGGRDGRTLVWQYDVDAAQLSLCATLACGGAAVSAVAISGDGASIWTASLDHKIRRWDRVAGEGSGGAYECRVTHDLGSAVLCLAVESQRQWLLAGTADGHAVVLDLAGDSCRPLAEPPPPAVIRCWRPHAGARTRCIAVYEEDMEGGGKEASVMTGGSDGRIIRVRLQRREGGAGSEAVGQERGEGGAEGGASEPSMLTADGCLSMEPLMPNHGGQVPTPL